jgi:hypothetical protein
LRALFRAFARDKQAGFDDGRTLTWTEKN